MSSKISTVKARVMWLRLLAILALALQSLVVVVLWTRLFDANVSRPSCQMAMIRWSFPAVWIASIVLWQLVVDGIREYDCALTRWCGKGGRVLLRVPGEFFHALGDGR